MNDCDGLNILWRLLVLSLKLLKQASHIFATDSVQVASAYCIVADSSPVQTPCLARLRNVKKARMQSSGNTPILLSYCSVWRSVN